MKTYTMRFDRGPSETFQAMSDKSARDYVIGMLHDEGAEEGDGGGLYRVNEGGRQDEEYLGEVRLGEDEEEGWTQNPPGYPGPCPEGMDWSEWLAFNNVD
jgi:hypothetical protein